MKLKITQILVGVFVLVLCLAGYRDVSASDRQPLRSYIELGRTMINSQVSVGGFGVRAHGRWDFHAGLMGDGQSKEGYQDQTFFWSVSRIFNPGWQVLFGCEIKPRIGIARTNHFSLVGDNNYRLGLLVACKKHEIEYFHYSSAGINDINSGVDGVSFRILSFF